MGHLSESSVIASYGGSIVHVAVNSQASTEAGEDFLPLTVDYRARMSAFGLLPEGSRRREKSPGSDEEILVARFIDRAVRPLFPSGYVDEVQVTITNHATDGVNDPTVLALNATSMALLKSNQPWFGPIGCVRVGLVENKLVVNPSVQSLKESPFDLLYAGTIDRTLMIEAVGSQVSESLVKEAIDLAHAEVREIIGVQKQLLENLKNDECKIEKIVKKTGYFVKEEYRDMVRNLFGEKTRAFYHAPHEGKEDRSKAEGILRSTILENVGTHPIISTEKPIVQAMLTDELITKSFRQALLENPPCRTDGRGANEVRKIDCATGVLPSVHGSAYFARGDTHVLSTVTVGNMKDARETVALDGSNNEKVDYFYLHYDFPPYCNGEVGALTLNRRMIGHGNLAERALRSVIPSFENFPYTVRIMAECTSSNGSSSMASACSGTLALLEAGVPIQAPVAGISIGLVTEPAFAAEMKEFASGEAPANGNYRILTDILGSEDHHGDMDFKIAGTTTGITAIQLDVKLPGGIPLNIIKEALDAGKTARLQILKTMEPYTSPGALKPNAPRAALIPIDINRIGHLLANNGEVLKYLIKTYDVDVKIIEDDKAYIFGKNGALFKEAASLLYDVATAMKEGDVVEGAVIDVKDFGLFVRVNQGQEALLHISQISHDARINKVPLEELFRKGQRLNVKIMTVDNVSGLVQLSRKALYDANEVDKLFGPDSNNATIEPSVDKLSEQFGSLTAAFPVTPGRKWSPDYFR
jgi:polyribonucleotide nucleotidyltransferase